MARKLWQKQSDAWPLTVSGEDVVIELLKGLTLHERAKLPSSDNRAQPPAKRHARFKQVAGLANSLRHIKKVEEGIASKEKRADDLETEQAP